MTWQDICSAMLLGLGVAIELLCCLGLLVAKDVYDRLHFTGPATALGPVLIAAAIVLTEALSTAGIKAILIAVILLGAGPTLTHAVARAARIRAHGAWQPQAGERIEEV